MKIEEGFLHQLKALATHAGARGFADDAAVMAWPLGLDLVLTHDVLAETVHYTPDCPAADVGWKLVAVNYSDLAAMGARPLGLLMGAGFGADKDAEWQADFLKGIRQALDRFGGALLGGDTVRLPDKTVLGATALGSVPPAEVLGRTGASDGDDLWVSGTIGDAGLGLRLLDSGRSDAAARYLIRRFRRPRPRMALGLALKRLASAAMDVSDGLLLDASRLAKASGLGFTLYLGKIPVSSEAAGEGTAIEDLAAFGDDYELLFAAPASAREAVRRVAEKAHVAVSRIGVFRAGDECIVHGKDGNVSELPAHLGYLHE